MFEIKAIQAENGDALFVSYGKEGDVRHILIDGGTEPTTPNLIEVLSAHCSNGRLRLEALVVTHYDLDHIEGILGLLKSKPEWLDIADVWFNGRKHLSVGDVLGAREGDELSCLIDGHYPWNKAFDGGTIRIKAGHTVTLDGGMKIWVLSPDQPRLSALAAKWPAGQAMPPAEDGARIPGDLLGRTDTWPPGAFGELAGTTFSEDSSVANGSSIALMLGYDEKLALLTGDAFPTVMVPAIKIHWGNQTPRVALLKLSHHGSKGNTDDALLKAIECHRFLISTSGKSHKHPDFVAIARVLNKVHNPQLIFNYDQPTTANWRTVPRGWPGLTAVYPGNGQPFVKVDLCTPLP